MPSKTIGFVFLLSLIPSWTNATEWIYEIQPGDSLWNLSRQFLKDIHLWPKLQSLNSIQYPRRLQPGTKIRVPMKWIKTAPGSATVTNIYGNVIGFEPGRQPRKLTVGGILHAGAVIQTASSSNVTLRFEDDSILLLKSNGEVKLKKLKVYPGTGMVDTRLEQKKGKSESKVTPKKGPGSRFEIKTPSAVAGVRGTVFRVEASPNGQITDSEVTKGEVEVKAGAAELLIPRGFGTSAKKGEQPSPPVELLPPPNLSNISSIFEQDPFYFRFPHITGAIAYQLEIAPDKQFTQLFFEQEFPSTTMKVSGLPEGKYVLRIRGVDHLGLEGFDSYHPFTVNTHPLPPKLLQPLPLSRISANQPRFRWQASEKNFGYQLQLASDFHFHHILLNKCQLQTSSFIAKLLPPGKYYWRVAALDNQGQRGPFSPGQSFIQLPPPPEIRIIEHNGVPALLRWKKPYDDARFRLQIAWDREFEMIIADTRIDKPIHSISLLQPGDYFVRIKTDAAGWEGPFSRPLPLRIPLPQ